MSHQKDKCQGKKKKATQGLGFKSEIKASVSVKGKSEKKPEIKKKMSLYIKLLWILGCITEEQMKDKSQSY